MDKVPSGSATRALALEYKSLQDEPVEGFRVKLVNDDNLFEWEVAIFGPPETLYQGAYFKAHMKFPNDYPYSPPSIKFLTKVWHPNVYEVRKILIASRIYAKFGDSSEWKTNFSPSHMKKHGKKFKFIRKLTTKKPRKILISLYTHTIFVLVPNFLYWVFPCLELPYKGIDQCMKFNGLFRI